MHDSPMDDSGGFGQQAYATIRGPRELFVRAGSTITFTCVVSAGGDAPALRGAAYTKPTRSHLKWTHAGRDVSFQVNLITTFLLNEINQLEPMESKVRRAKERERESYKMVRTRCQLFFAYFL